MEKRRKDFYIRNLTRLIKGVNILIDFTIFDQNKTKMHCKYLLLFIAIVPIISFSQTRDMSNWIDFGSDNVSKYLQIAPGKLGPNALLTPRMDYARVGTENKAELGAHYHYMKGDTAINSFFSFYWSIAPGRAAIEIWGQPSETFHMSNEVRDERQIYYDDTGWTTQAGDILISTYVQLVKEKKYIPSVSINYTLKTTTGSNTQGRFTNADMDYFYMAAGKSFCFDKGFIDEIRIAGLLGFYVWQTNKVEMGQDEGPVFEGGVQLRKENFNLYVEYGGFKGWDAYEFIDRISGQNRIEGNNDPLIMRTRLEKTGKHFDFTIEYQTGFRDYHYQTFRFGTIYRFKTRKF